ncbi:MAG: tolB [Caulobacteraceae bacterium]|nr:tolB [Caulobacteraceae bacterium]
MRLPIRTGLVLGLCLILAAAAPGLAQTALPPVAALAAVPTPALPGGPIEIDVDQGAVKPIPIAIPDFEGPQGAEISKVVADDLASSGRFLPLDKGTFIERNLNTDIQPNFPNWVSVGAQGLVNGRVSAAASGELRVDFRLWDIPRQQQMQGSSLISTTANLRRVAHKIADAVYEKLTGEGGYFDTRIVFIAESGPRNARVKTLRIMDQDGANPSSPPSGAGASLILTPRFSPDGHDVTYMSLGPEGSAIYLMNIETGRQERLGGFRGDVSAPRFSPDGNSLALSQSINGNSDIYVMNLRSRALTRLTTDPNIDTSPSFSQDGGQIAFTSDRAGSQQIYVMSANGGGARRISSGSGNYSTPVWSPKSASGGDFIAFTKQTGSTFHIGVMRPDGSDERLLTTSYLDEGPTWAPNGRVLMFFRQASGGDPKLWTVDVTGRILRAAPYEGSGSDPAWSPLLDSQN